jgi:hypothetical protein
LRPASLLGRAPRARTCSKIATCCGSPESVDREVRVKDVVTTPSQFTTELGLEWVADVIVQ